VSWKKFLLSINSIGILLLWMGPPLIYFLKSLISPNAGFLFTGFFYIIGIVLMKSITNIKVGIIPNLELLLFGGIFFSLTQFYLFLYNAEPQNYFADILNLVLIIFYFLQLLKIENSLKSILPFWIFIFTIVINICLVYSIATNPLYNLGVRATVQFGSDQFTGNPYVYARNGFAGFIISYLLIKFRNTADVFISNFFTQFFCYFNLWLSLVVIILTQTRTIFLSFILILFPLLFFVGTENKFSIKNLFSFPFILFYSLFGLIIYYFDNQFNLFGLISYYYSHSLEIFTNALDTGINMGSNVQDESAMARVGGIKNMVNIITERPEFILTGGGYRFLYMDIPFLEAFINFGLFPFLFYFGFQLYLFKHAIYAIFSKDILQVFLGFMSFQILIAIFTTGRCLDFSYWVSYLVFIRFFNSTSIYFKEKMVEL
jgi:hypothetical protein